MMWRPVQRKTLKFLFVFGALASLPSAAHAEPATELLWPEGAPGAKGQAENDQPKLILYRAAQEAAAPTAVVICPGGGYGHLAMDHEGHQIAAWLNSLGVTAAICDYRHRGKGYGHPAPLDDAQRAIRTLRHRAADLNVAPNQIGILGFSAGGHLASTAATKFDAGQTEAADPVMQQSSRPDFAVLCYPVISFTQPCTHTGSRRNLLGADATDEQFREFSSELNVTAKTPPTFLFSTSEDTGVPPENSILFYQALVKAKVPAELHIFQRGRHGLGLAASVPGTRAWPQLCASWFEANGWLKK
ncbi:MAG: alpha/beta hydrolase [Planctomycetales bacterium]|nr:alpha/beta hydrolase [Planctomycetales bacterium]